VVVLNNLSGEEIKGWIPETAQSFEDLLTGETVLPGDYTLKPYGYVWLKPVVRTDLIFRLVQRASTRLFGIR